MIPLFHCKACGFLSTLGTEFTTISGVRFDKDCAERAKLGQEPYQRWVAEALAAPRPLSESKETGE